MIITVPDLIHSADDLAGSNLLRARSRFLHPVTDLLQIRVRNPVILLPVTTVGKFKNRIITVIVINTIIFQFVSGNILSTSSK